MTEEVFLKYVDNVHVKVVANPGIVKELGDEFTFFAPNYKFHPKYRSRMWDGRIRLVNTLTGYLYAGLAQRVKKFCEARDYTFRLDDKLLYEDVSEHEIKEHINKLKIPKEYDERQYQVDSIVKCIRTGRRTLLSPTSSGKSLIIYVISTWYAKHKKLIIVPTISLVNQLEGDFRDYGYKGKVHKSTDKGGLSKEMNIKADVIITTWQSLNNGKTKMPKGWYNQFGVVFGDEAHGAKATSLIQILSSMTECRYRFGTTGTLDGEPLNETTIEGLFGAKYQSITTRELIDQGFASKFQVKCLVLRYSDADCKLVRKMEYPDEVKFLINHPKRNKFIKNLTLSLKGNKLVFFRQRDHGDIIYQLIMDGKKKKNVFYIDGTISGEVREQIRHAIEDEEDATLIASLGTTSTGTNIKRLHHMISAWLGKGKIKVLQSIGRMLRLHAEKQAEGAILYDIVDDLSIKDHKNYALKHFAQRCEIYDSEEFEYKIYNIGLGK